MTEHGRQGLVKRVLVADDERHVARLVQVNLEKQGFDVTLATDGREAVDCLESGQYDVAVLDLIMPRMNGYEVLEWIRTHKDTQDMKVVLMTADAYWWQQQTDMPYQADSYVAKPFNPREILPGD